MKKLVLSVFTLSLAGLSTAQSVAGDWQGLLAAGMQKLRLVFHVQADSAPGYRSSFDSPDQGAFGIACSETSLQGDSLAIQIKLINGGYRGKWDGKDSIRGYYFQNGLHFPLNLGRGAAAATAPVRPQTPKPPFPYRSEELEYDDPASGIHYSGTLTLPQLGRPFPAALLITGSGQQDRDETIFGHKPFAVIADYLTRRGYAVLRVDDRQTGKSTGDVSKATTQDFAADAEVSLRELRKRKDIDPARTGLIGHSEGGLIAAMVGAEDPNVDFIIMLAGPGLRGDRLLSLQREAIVRANGVNEKAGEASGALSDLLTEAVLHSPDSSVQLQQALQAFASWKKHTDTAIVSRMGLQDDRQAEHFIRLQLKTMRNPWLLYFLQTDPAVYLRRLRCWVLALNGSKDVQVVPDANLAAIDSALKQSKAKGYTLEKLPGLNHLFQHCKTCTASEYAQLEETFAPEALQRMGDWLDKNVKP